MNKNPGSIERRPMGRTGLQVSRIGLGCVTFGREIDEETSFRIMDYAVLQGLNLFDTAEAYGGGASELIIGRWLRDRKCRNQIILQTKVKPTFTRKLIHESLERSLDRLGVDCTDIYLLHEFDDLTPLAEAMDAMTQAVASRRVRAAGCSNFALQQLCTSEEISRVNGLTRFEIVQPVYNLLARDIESGLLAYCREKEVGVVTYSPIAAGFLTGKYARGSKAVPPGSRFDAIPGHRDIYFRPENFAVVEKLRELSIRSGIPMSRLALGWALRNGSVDSILVGARSITHIQNAIQALRSPLDPKLTEEMDCWTAVQHTN